jgi:teichoic acid transport system permease protein
VQFPRALLPLASIIEHLVTFAPAMILLFVVTVLDGSGIRWHMLLFPLVVVLVVFAFSGGALISARLGSFVSGLRELLPHIFRLLMHASGVIFSIDGMIGNARLRSVLKANPIHIFISLGRWSMLGMSVSTGAIIGAAVWAVVLPIVGFLFFRAGEDTYGG